MLLPSAEGCICCIEYIMSRFWSTGLLRFISF
ncbi:hypothetical protein RDI58_014511 [Solanum bulbocastanum]|uniref:Uncharacterized protein n=1 Tax=Solanum bulbocastanum TaxID=147425 RepID=A0AAN8TIC0_SOLBU